MKAFTISAFAAVSTLAFLITPASAAIVDASVGELILGFRADANPGQVINLEVDLGSASLFYNATPGTTFTLAGLKVADLVGIYGAGWNTRTDLFWGVAGTTGATSDAHSAVDTLWLTAPRTSLDTQSTPLNRQSKFAQQGPANTISTMFQNGSPGTLKGATSTANSTTAASINATVAGSWSFQENPGITSFGLNASIDNTTNISSGSFAISDLYELQPGSGAGAYLGYFSLSNSGVLSFTAAPEPSSIALALGSAGLLALRRRRRGTGVA